MTLSFTIPGPPRTKKTSQRIFKNKRTGRPFVMPSEKSVDWEEHAVNEMLSRLQPRDRNGYDGPVWVEAVFWREANRGDLTGYMQALADALQKDGVIKNDSQIESWDGSGKLVDAANPRVEVTVEYL